jgi:hypothetical protein
MAMVSIFPHPAFVNAQTENQHFPVVTELLGAFSKRILKKFVPG